MMTQIEQKTKNQEPQQRDFKSIILLSDGCLRWSMYVGDRIRYVIDVFIVHQFKASIKSGMSARRMLELPVRLNPT